MTPAFVVAIMAVLNRVRGGGLWGARLPGHPRFWCAGAVVALSCLVLGDPLHAAWFAGAWLAWALVSWSDVYLIGHVYGQPVNRAEFWPCISGLFAIGLLPALALFMLTPWALLLAPAMPLANLAGWAAYDRWPRLNAQTPIAEPLMGAAWGLVLILI